MQLTVHGRHLEVTDWIRQYIEKKVNRLERYLPQMQEIRAELTQSETRAAADRYTAQITVWVNGQILRAEESTSDIFASIDATIDKMASQMQRFKGRRFQNRRRASAAASMEAEMNELMPVTQDEEEEAEAAFDGHIIRRKQFVLEPMNEEEALEQMELLGHDFFVFFNPDANAVNVIYRRRDSNYGLLQPLTA
jgi:putative sigma-54 modulation protein